MSEKENQISEESARAWEPNHPESAITISPQTPPPEQPPPSLEQAERPGGNVAVDKVHDLPGLRQGERILYIYDGRYLDWLPDKIPFSRHNTLWLTNKRIIIREVTYLFGVKIASSFQFFKYKDLQNVSMEIDWRLEIIAITIGAWILRLRVVDVYSEIGVIVTVVLGLVIAMLTLFYLTRFALREELKLDFYKTETVNTWLFLLDKIFWRRPGSSIEKSLMFKIEEIFEIIKILHDHKLTNLSQEEEPESPDEQEENGSPEASGQPDVHPQPTTSTVQSELPQFALTPPSAEPTVQRTNRPSAADIANELLLPGEVVIAKAWSWGLECYPHRNLLAEVLCCLTWGTSYNSIVLTDRRILVSSTQRPMMVLYQTKRESLRYRDLQYASIGTEFDYWGLARTLILLLIASLLFVLGKVNSDESLTIAGYVFAAAFGITVIYVFFRSLTDTKLTLDFYKPETIHSWLTTVNRALAWRHGSSSNITLVLSVNDCRKIIKALFLHPRTCLTDDKED